ncbi:MAG: flagellar hook-basal body complex protein FliE [Candidatus Gastranaerophilales bacterium]|nr:flagellar hook-basal body complex protein FliE [Candidatus Gastranaerophilales bacterium]
MSDAIGGIGKFGMNYTPISNYNKILENSLGKTNINGSNDSVNDFQNILDNQISAIEHPNQKPEPINMGITMDVNANAMQFNANQNSDNPHLKVASAKESSLVQNTAGSISNAFSNSLNSINNTQVEANKAVETLASGGNISVHDVMIASEKASLNMQMAIQVRNKMINAYNELYQMRF